MFRAISADRAEELFIGSQERLATVIGDLRKTR
jgi:hypothetical protein